VEAHEHRGHVEPEGPRKPRHPLERGRMPPALHAAHDGAVRARHDRDLAKGELGVPAKLAQAGAYALGDDMGVGGQHASSMGPRRWITSPSGENTRSKRRLRGPKYQIVGPQRGPTMRLYPPFPSGLAKPTPLRMRTRASALLRRSSCHFGRQSSFVSMR